jgi:hypothetical protein
MTYDHINTNAGPHVLIVGAGITGLLIAQGLKRVWLSHPNFTPMSWKITLGFRLVLNTPYLMRKLQE